jgi:hypothetical protein
MRSTEIRLLLSFCPSALPSLAMAFIFEVAFVVHGK